MWLPHRIGLVSTFRVTLHCYCWVWLPPLSLALNVGCVCTLHIVMSYSVCHHVCVPVCVCAFILLWFFSLTIGKQIFACFTLSVSPCLFLLLLIWPLLMFNFFFPFYLKSLHNHCTLPSKNTIQISPLRSTGRLVSLLFTLLKPRPWQTGAVLRPHLARRLRPVPASLFKTPIPQCNLLILFAPHSPTPAAMLPCTTCQIVSCSLRL